MTLKERIAADASAVFLNTDEFAETIVHEPLGVAAAGVEVVAIVDLDAEDEIQGAEVQDAQGRRIYRVAILELPASVVVTVNERAESCDTFLIGGSDDEHRWWAVRLKGRDAALQTVVVRRVEKVFTSRTRLR